jgi:hypothetical protein
MMTDEEEFDDIDIEIPPLRVVCDWCGKKWDENMNKCSSGCSDSFGLFKWATVTFFLLFIIAYFASIGFFE